MYFEKQIYFEIYIQVSFSNQLKQQNGQIRLWIRFGEPMRLID
jgi:hypothetical protein